MCTICRRVGPRPGGRSAHGDGLETGAFESLDVSSLVAADRFPDLGEATLGLDCTQCDNTVTSEGISATVGEETYEFCCESCEARFRERYEDLKEDAHRLSKG